MNPGQNMSDWLSLPEKSRGSWWKICKWQPEHRLLIWCKSQLEHRVMVWFKHQLRHRLLVWYKSEGQLGNEKMLCGEEELCGRQHGRDKGNFNQHVLWMPLVGCWGGQQDQLGMKWRNEEVSAIWEQRKHLRLIRKVVIGRLTFKLRKRIKKKKKGVRGTSG